MSMKMKLCVNYRTTLKGFAVVALVTASEVGMAGCVSMKSL